MEDLKKETAKDLTFHKLKEFKLRDSLLTDLFKINHIKCIKNFCLVFFIQVTLQMIATDLYYVGRYNLRFFTEHLIHF